MKVDRKSIPDSVKVQVALRQLQGLKASDSLTTRAERERLKDFLFRLKVGLLTYLGNPLGKLELHHRPALVNRPYDERRGDYDPPANDPDHLFYLLKEEQHRIETYVRGVGALRSDVSQRRYLKRVAKNREKDSQGVRRLKRGVDSGRKSKVSRKPTRRQAMRAWQERYLPKPKKSVKRPWPKRPFPTRTDNQRTPR